MPEIESTMNERVSASVALEEFCQDSGTSELCNLPHSSIETVVNEASVINASNSCENLTSDDCEDWTNTAQQKDAKPWPVCSWWHQCQTGGTGTWNEQIIVGKMVDFFLFQKLLAERVRSIWIRIMLSMNKLWKLSCIIRDNLSGNLSFDSLSLSLGLCLFLFTTGSCMCIRCKREGFGCSRLVLPTFANIRWIIVSFIWALILFI